MKSTVISLRRLRYEKQYAAFYSNPHYRNLSLHCFFKSDVTYKKKIKIV
jgi:hypothetical protein